MEHKDTKAQSFIPKEEYKRLNQLSNTIIGAAIEVHRELGPGLLESVYEECLKIELESLGLNVRSQVDLPLVYKGIKVDKEYRIDLVVNNEFIIELKAVEILKPLHEVQLLTYMKLAHIHMGLLINFNVPVLKDGIKRKINGLIEYKDLKTLR